MTPTPDTELMAAVARLQTWVDSQNDPLGPGDGGPPVYYDDVRTVLARIASTRPADSALGDELAADFELFRRDPDFGAVKLASTMLLHSEAILEALASEPQPRADSPLMDDLSKLAIYADHAGLGRADRDVIAAIYSRMSEALRQPAPRADDALRDMAQFLIARIDEMDWCNDLETFANEWNGHVDPPLCRLRKALASEEPTDAAKGD